jgi:hypothetical protein
MGVTELAIILIFIIVVGSLLLFQRRIEGGTGSVGLRPIAAYEAVHKQLGMAMESGRRPFFTLGSGALQSEAGPTSVAGLYVLDEQVETTARGQLSPLVTVGAGTLLPLATHRLAFAGDEHARPSSTAVPRAQFIADASFPFAYAAGTADVIQNENLQNSIAVGRFGTELALIGEAASRAGMEQIMGSDEPAAIAIALANTENSLWGEEIFAAGAYLRGTSPLLAAARSQDLLRWLVIAALFIATVLQVLGLL